MIYKYTIKKIIMTVLLLLCVIFILFMQGCKDSGGIIEPNSQNNSFKLDEKVFFNKDNYLTIINGVSLQNIVEFNISDEYSIASNLENSIFKLSVYFNGDEFFSRKAQELNSVFFNPVINKDGDFAYALHEGQNNLSRIFYNGNEIGIEKKGLYKELNLNSNYLISQFINTDGHYLYVFDLYSEKSAYIMINIIPDSFDLRDDLVSLKGISFSEYKRKEIVIDLQTLNVIDEIKLLGKADLEQLAVKHLLSYDPFLSFSCFNNYDGRQTWYLSYRLEALIAYDMATESEYPFEAVITKSLNCLLNSFKKERGANNYGWPTTKYSINGDNLSLLVNNARIMYSLIKVINHFELDNNLEQKILVLAREMFIFYEDDYDIYSMNYRFRYGEPYWADGLKVPWNMQNIMGLMLIELYYSTLDSIYLERVEQLYSSFSNQWVLKDGLLVWHYWPDEFYKGWEDETFSSNTPSKASTVDNLYEDTSHAAENIKFIIEACKLINHVNCADQRELLLNTTSNLYQGRLFSRFMSGEVNYSSPSVKYFPYHAGGWAALKSEDLFEFSNQGIPNIDVFFEGDYALALFSFAKN